jgi:predicted nucleic acid-binding Zn ribbon protein
VERLGEILNRLMAQEGYAHRGGQGAVFERWNEMVGEILSQKSWPVSLRNRVLLVRVSGSVWMQELQMQKRQIMERIWDLVGEEEVKDIRWTVRGNVPRMRRPQAPSDPPARATRPLNEEESAWVEAVASQVEDPDLRNTLGRLLGKYLRSPWRERGS